MAPDYVFRPMSAGDLPLIRHWLEMPEVMRWWGPPEAQYALLRRAFDHPDMRQFIVALGGQPFGYIQCYRLTTRNLSFGLQPAGARGIDQFIGEPGMLGCGHGSGFVRQFVDRLLASGTSRVVTDPDPGNGRAVRAYQKAGFQSDRMIDTPDGPALLMVRDP